MKKKMPQSKKLIEMVKGNAAVINEIYVSVMAIRKAVSLIGSALGDMNIRLEKLRSSDDADVEEDDEADIEGPSEYDYEIAGGWRR